MVIHATEGFDLQCNNVARQVKENVVRITGPMAIGFSYDLVTWYKITHAGEQNAQWDFRNNAIRTRPPGPAFVLEVPLRNLLTSMCDFLPCDRIL